MTRFRIVIGSKNPFSDGALRGVVLHSGESEVILRYLPGSIITGSVLSLAAFIATFIAFVLPWRRNQAARKMNEVPTVS